MIQIRSARVVDEIVLGGCLSSFTAACGIAMAECAVETVAAAAGLGAAPGQAQRDTLADYLDDVGETLRGWHVDPPDFTVA